MLASTPRCAVLCSWPFTIEAGQTSTLQSPVQGGKLELTLIKKEALPESCHVSFLSTARTVELLVDEGDGKFSYLSSHRGSPQGNMFCISISLSATIKQAKLRLMSLVGDKGKCTIQGLEVSVGGPCASQLPLQSNSNLPEAQGVLTALNQASNPAQLQQQPLTQSAQIRQLLQQLASEGGNLEVLPPESFARKIAQAASGTTGGGMMARIVQSMARNALAEREQQQQQQQQGEHLSQPVKLEHAEPVFLEQQELHDRMKALEISLASVKSSVSRLESGQQAILQGQHTILRLLEGRRQ